MFIFRLIILLASGSFGNTLCTTILPQYFYWNTEIEIFVKCNSNSRWKLEVNSEDQSLLYSSGWLNSNDEIVSLLLDTLPSNNKFWVYLFMENEVNKESWLVTGTPDLVTTFIQTNKPIYTPGENVEIRILPIDVDGKLFTGNLQISILNQQNFALLQEENVQATAGFIRSNFALPAHIFAPHDVNKSETWKIRVAPQSSLSAAFYQNFEVAEYDLPEFEIFFDCDYGLDIHRQKLINKITIIAKYAYGKPVFGDASVLCVDAAQKLQLISASNLKLINGAAVFEHLDVASCLQDGQIELTGRVRDSVTGHVESLTKTINLNDEQLDMTIISPFLLKPINGDRMQGKFVISEKASSVDRPYIDMKASCLRNNKIWVVQSRSLPVSKEIIDFSIDATCDLVILNASHGFSEQSIATIIPKLPNVQGITVTVPQVAKVGEIIEVEIKPPADIGVLPMTYLVICNNKIIKFEQSVTLQSFNIAISDGMIPSCEVAVFSGRQFAALERFGVKSSCTQNTGMTITRADAQSPDMTLMVDAFPNGIVGLNAIDTRLVHLANKLNLFNSAPESRMNWRWIAGTKMGTTIAVAGLMENIETAIGSHCTTAGRVWRQQHSSCPELHNGYSAVTGLCIQFFAAGCNEQKAPPTAPICDPRSPCKLEDMLRIAGFQSRTQQPNELQADPLDKLPLPNLASKDSQQESMHPPSIRKFFPETWLFEDVQLDGAGKAYLTRTIPDSITNWTIGANAWAFGKHQICQLKPLSLLAVQSCFMEINVPKVVYIGELVMVEIVVINMEETQEDYAVCYKYTDGACTIEPQTTHAVDNAMYYSSGVQSHEDQPNIYSALIPIEFWKLGELKLDFKLVKTGQACSEENTFLDAVQIKVEVKEKQSLREHFKTYIMNPHKINPHHTQTYLDDQLLSYYEVDNPEFTKVDAIINLNASTNTPIKSFRVELRKFTPKWPILNRSLTSRPKRSISTSPFLEDVLKKLSVDFYLLKTAMHERMPDSLVNEMMSEVSTSFGDLFSYNDCYKTDVYQRFTGDPQCSGVYSNERFPDRDADGSHWMTIVSTLLHCEYGSDPTVICPSFHYVLNAVKEAGLYPDFSEPLQDLQYSDQQRLIHSMAFLMYYQCADVINYCQGAFSVDDIKDGANHKLLRDLFEHRKHPQALAASAYVASYASNLTLHPMQFMLKNMIRNMDKQPYWIYQPKKNVLSRMWRKFIGLFNSSNEHRRLSNEILLNSMAFLSFNHDSTVPLDLDPLYDWLQSQPNMYLMDTYFRNQALYRKLAGGGSKSSNGGRRTNITVDCALCSKETRVIDQDEIAVIYVPAATRELKLKTQGQDKVQVGVRLVLEDETPSRSRRDSSDGEGRFDPSMPWPVNVSVSKTYQDDMYHQRICIKTDIPDLLLDVLDIQHTPFTGYKFVADSFRTDDAIRKIPSLTQMGLFVTVFGLTSAQWSCYNVSQKEVSVVGEGSSFADVAVFVTHKKYGLVGKKYLAASTNGGGTTIPIEKVCVNNHSCVCTASVCNGNMCQRCQTHGSSIDDEIDKFTQFIALQTNFALKVKILAKTTQPTYADLEFTIDKSYKNKVNMTSTSALRIPTKTCTKCFANLEEGAHENAMTFVIAGKISNVIMDPVIARSVYILQSGDYFEGLFGSCHETWTVQILSQFENT